MTPPPSRSLAALPTLCSAGAVGAVGGGLDFLRSWRFGVLPLTGVVTGVRTTRSRVTVIFFYRPPPLQTPGALQKNLRRPSVSYWLMVTPRRGSSHHRVTQRVASPFPSPLPVCERNESPPQRNLAAGVGVGASPARDHGLLSGRAPRCGIAAHERYSASLARRCPMSSRSFCVAVSSAVARPS